MKEKKQLWELKDGALPAWRPGTPLLNAVEGRGPLVPVEVLRESTLGVVRAIGTLHQACSPGHRYGMVGAPYLLC